MDFNKDVLFAKIALGFSLIALVLSIIAVIGVNKTKNAVIGQDITVVTTEKKDKIFDNIQEVEIIKSDGSIQKVSANKSSDQLSKIVDEKSGFVKKNKEQKKEIVSSKKEKKSVAQPVMREDTKQKKNNEKSKFTEKITQNKKKDKAFVIQIGAFKEKSSSEKQCEQVKSFIGNKKCVVEQNAQKLFCTIIRDFDDMKSAENFAKDLSSKTKIYGIIKKN